MLPVEIRRFELTRVCHAILDSLLPTQDYVSVAVEGLGRA